jgi:hypothetical protein
MGFYHRFDPTRIGQVGFVLLIFMVGFVEFNGLSKIIDFNQPFRRCYLKFSYLKLSITDCSSSNIWKTLSNPVLFSNSWIFFVRFKSLS